MAAFLAIGITSVVVLLFLGGVAIFTIVEEEYAIQEKDIARCFPSLEGSVRIANEGFSFLNKKSDPKCELGNEDENCDCFLSFSLDGKEEFRHKVTNSGVPDQYYDLDYNRWRHQPLNTMHVSFDNQTLSYDLIFDTDLTSILFVCEEGQPPSASCARIIVQKTRENYRKLRSCSRHDLIWHIDDKLHETPQ